MSGNLIRTDLLAKYCGLAAPSSAKWEEWLQDLCEDDLLMIRGRITQQFGRPDFVFENNNPTTFLLRYLSVLEKEFCDWSTTSNEIVDYYLASMVADLGDTSTSWYWQSIHKSTWLATSRSDDSTPKGIRVAPLISDTLGNLIDNVLAPYISQFLKCVGDTVEQREHWIERVERLEADLYGSENAFCGAFLKELRDRRLGHHDNESVDFLRLSDIADVARIAQSHNVVGLKNYLSDLEEAVSDLSSLGTIDFWNHAASGQHERSIIERLLAKYRNLGWFEVNATRLIRDSESRQAADLLDVLRTRLTSHEFRQHSLSINRVHCGLQSMIGISEWSRSITNSLQREIEKAIREVRRGESRFESAPEIDHWRAPKR